MDPKLFDQILTLVLPVALVLLALNIGSQMTGLGKGMVKKLTGKITSGLLAIGIIWFLVSLAAQMIFHKL